MLILTAARIHTLDPKKPVVQVLAIDRGRIAAAGDLASIQAAVSPGSRKVDLGDRTVIPGLTDAHIHLQTYALGLQKLDCGTGTLDECLQRVAARAESTSPGEWITGHGWNQNEWVEGFGSAAQLDVVAPNSPVYLTAKSLHAAWANSAALRRAGITANTPDPRGGQIQRDARGKPTGILLESAMSLVADRVPAPDPHKIAQAILDAQPGLWRMGLTGVHDFDRRECFAALQILHSAGLLKLRVTKSIPIEDLDHALALGLRSGFGDDFLRIGSVKAFSDGALGPRTAAMLQPYEGEPENCGLLLLDKEEIVERGRPAVENGLSLAIHAIGDLANHEVLESYSQLRKIETAGIDKQLHGGSARTLERLRHRIEHVQIIHPDDAPKLAPLGIIASMQPIHVISDFPAADRYWGQRSENAYAWRTLRDLGTMMAFGSDAPVESPNPFWGLHAAVTRRRPDGPPGPEGWYPTQRLNLMDAVQGFTYGAAYAAGMEHCLGKLAPGYLADLLVLETDLFACPTDEIPEIRPVATMVHGEWVFAEHRLSGALADAENHLHEP